MANQVPVHVARERNHVLRELAAAKKFEFQQLFVGQTLEAITLTHQLGGRTEALTDNYQKLWIEGSHAPNQAVSAEITAVEGEALIGRI
jgi:tRNA A37 methylthiotransferase MiaB